MILFYSLISDLGGACANDVHAAALALGDRVGVELRRRLVTQHHAHACRSIIESRATVGIASSHSTTPTLAGVGGGRVRGGGLAAMAQRRTAVGMDAVGAQPAAAARLDQHAVRRVALQPYVVQAVTMRDRGCNHI